MSQLQKLLDEYTSTEATAGRNPEEYSFVSRPGIEASIRRAKDSLEDLAKKYGKAFLSNALGVFLTGPGAASIANAAKASAVVVDASELYRRVAAEVDLTLGPSRQFTANQGSRALTELIKIGSELRIASMKNIEFGRVTEAPTLDVTQTIIRNGVRKALGDDLNRMYIEAAAQKQALGMKFAGASPPVFVVNAQADEVEGLSAAFGKGAVPMEVASTEEPVTEETVGKLLKEVNRRVKKK